MCYCTAWYFLDRSLHPYKQQVRYYRVTGRNLVFPRLKMMLYFISIGCLLCALLFLMSLSALLEGSYTLLTCFYNVMLTDLAFQAIHDFEDGLFWKMVILIWFFLFSIDFRLFAVAYIGLFSYNNNDQHELCLVVCMNNILCRKRL